MTIEDDISFFERVPTLSQLGRQALRILAIGAETRYIHGGEVLFNAGEEADGGFVIQEGRFNLSSFEDGREVTVGPCTLLGEVALFTETTRPITATALEPSTVLRIPRPLFVKMLDSFPDAARKLREIMATRLNQSSREIYNVRAALDAHEPK
jgi:CRP-like cAMP-binding protein